MRKGDDDPPALAHHPGELVLGLGEATCGDRGALGLEHVRLRPRQRVESGGALEARGLEPLLLPEAGDVVDLPDEVGGVASSGTRSASSSPLSRSLPTMRSRAG